MKTNQRAKAILATLLVGGASLAALAQEESRPRDAQEAYREGYQRGYEDGFERGYRKAQEEARAEAAQPPRPTGPITVSSARYGTSSKSCDATRYVARRANGKRSYSFEVSNEMCGDPSHGDRKELQVSYICGALAKSASANEHRNIYLDCSP